MMLMLLMMMMMMVFHENINNLLDDGLKISLIYPTDNDNNIWHGEKNATQPIEHKNLPT
jgi:hypothetical protein